MAPFCRRLPFLIACAGPFFGPDLSGHGFPSDPAQVRSGPAGEDRFEFVAEFDCGRGGAYSLALNSDASRLYVVGESSWLDILDITNPSAIRSVNQLQVNELPYGSDSEFGIAYDLRFQRLVAGGGTGNKVYLLGVSGDQLQLLDAAYPPERQFPAANLGALVMSPPAFVKGGNAVAVAMLTGGSADDPSSGQKVYFGEGIAILSIDPGTGKMSVIDEGIGGLSAVYGHAYDAGRDMLWGGGVAGAEAVLDLSGGDVSESRCWAGPLDEEGPRICPDVLTRDGRWLIERIASRFPANEWSLRIRQIEAANGEYALWNADMPTDGASPRLLGSSAANWNGHAAPSSRLLPCVLSHDETGLLTAESGGHELLILDLTDKTTSPQFLSSVNVGDGEEIQSIKGHRNRFYVSLKSGWIRVYQWGYVHQPAPPSDFSAVASTTDQSILLSWTAPAMGVPPVGYNIYRRTAETPFKKVVSVAETQWTDAATTEGETYFYVVRSYAPQHGPVESNDSSEAEATAAIGIPPAKVFGLTATSTLAGILLTWQPNPEADVRGYLIYRKIGDAVFEKITPSPIADACFLDLDMFGGAGCFYYLTATDGHSEGPASDAVTAAPADRTDNLLLNAGAEEQSTRRWVNASSIPAPDPANRYSFNNDLFIAVTNAYAAEGQWAFWADQTRGRYDRETDTYVDETYLLAAYQDVDVAAFAGLIQSPERNIVADWGGQVIRTSSDQSVVPSIAIEFLDTQQTVIARKEFSSEKMGEWENLASSDAVPASTTTLRFWMFARDVRRAPANAAWDALYLILREEPPPQPPEVTLFSQPTGILVVLSVTSLSASYQIQYTDNLPAGTDGWKPCGPILPGNGGAVEWLDSPDETTNPTDPPAHSASRRFYRVRQQ